MTAESTAPLDPKLDVVFRALFGHAQNTDLVLSLLNGILDLSGPDTIVAVDLLSPMSDIAAVEEKQIVLDVYVRAAAGNRYAIEMQCRNHLAFPERMLYYAARTYGNQLRRSSDYSTLQPLVLIVFTDFVLFPEVDPWRQHYALRDQQSGRLFSDHLRVVLVELPKLRLPATPQWSLGEQWGVFLQEGTRMKTRVDDKPWLTPAVRKAIEELERMAGDPRLRDIYETRQEELRVQATELRSSYLEGREEGREEGIRATAQRMLAEGDSAERVARITGLPLDEVQEMARS